MLSSVVSSRPGICLAVAIVVAFAFGLMAAGCWPSVPVHAGASDRTEGFAMATGYCDEQVEAVYFLDFLTGDLSAAVVSKQNGKFNAFYTYNVTGDLGTGSSRQPQYLMTTGSADLRRSGGKSTSLSRSLLYVAEKSSGKVAAYAIPWSSSAWNAGQTLRGQFTLLDVGRFRSTGGAASGKGE
jgi:hypothetical protein